MAHSKKGDAGVSDLANVQTRTRELGCLKNNTNSVEAIVTRMQTSFLSVIFGGVRVRVRVRVRV